MLGNDHRLIGWFRDARCVPPNWALAEVNGRAVTLPGHAGKWTVEFIETASGKVLETRMLQAGQTELLVPLPTFRGSVALRLTASREADRARE